MKKTENVEEIMIYLLDYTQFKMDNSDSDTHIAIVKDLIRTGTDIHVDNRDILLKHAIVKDLIKTGTDISIDGYNLQMKTKTE